jgi:catechol 2,3-dioxygenase-like lactoylglutathione lyase family enzyme
MIDLKLEVLVIPVSDVDRAKRFYEKLGFRVDVDYDDGRGYRVIQCTPPGSKTSIIFGKGVTLAQPGSIDRLLLAVDDIEAARDALVSQGVEVQLFHDAGGGLGGGFHAGAEGRAGGPDPQRRSYASYGSFSDPDGNVWLLQEIKERLPGRGGTTGIASLAPLLKETSEHHGSFEAVAPPHNWWDWYAAYMDARERGGSPVEAAAAAGQYMAVAKQVGVSSA